MMPIADAIRKLSVLALIIEIIHRAVIALVNMLRMLLSEDYRNEIFNNEIPPLETAA